MVDHGNLSSSSIVGYGKTNRVNVVGVNLT